MNMLQNPSRASSVLRDWTQANAGLDDCYLSDARDSVSTVALATRSVFAGRLKELAGRSILIATDHQLAAGLALLELDGLARRIIVCPPDIASAISSRNHGGRRSGCDRFRPRKAGASGGRCDDAYCQSARHAAKRRRPFAALSDRMGVADFWHHRRAKGGCPHAR